MTDNAQKFPLVQGSPTWWAPLLVLALAVTSAPARAACLGNTWTATPPASFSVDGAHGVVSDSRTQLMWQLCPRGQTGTSCAGTAGLYSWSQALDEATAANTASDGGYNDWRVPNVKELQSLVETGCTAPAIQSTVFPNTPSAEHWTSTSYAATPGSAWYVEFTEGAAFLTGKGTSHVVRLVRGGSAAASYTRAVIAQNLIGLAASPATAVVNGTATLSVSSSGASGNPVVYGSFTPLVCTVTGNTVSYGAAGTCNLTADQAGNTTYGAATQATLSLTVARAAQTLTGFAAAPAAGTVGATATLSVSGQGSSGNPVVYGSSSPLICSVSGTTVSFLATGTCQVSANQAGNANYLAAPALSLNIPVGVLPQVLSGLAVSPGSGTVGSSGVLSVTGQGASGNPVVYASQTPAVCGITGNTVTYLAQGICTVSANQAGGAGYGSATPVLLNITVALAAATPAAVPALAPWALGGLMALIWILGVLSGRTGAGRQRG